VPRGIPASGCFSPIVNFFCAKALSEFSVSMHSVERKLRRPPSRRTQGTWTHLVSSKPCLILLLAIFGLPTRSWGQNASCPQATAVQNTPVAAPGWSVQVHATNVSGVSGGEALAADLNNGNLWVKSLFDR
jgi:hypothetical protein